MKEYKKPEMKIINLTGTQELLCGSNPYWNDCNAGWGWGEENNNDDEL